MTETAKKELELVLRDLSGEEIQIYELALLRGYITTSMVLNLNLKKPAKKIEEHLKKLEQRKLVKKLPGIVPRYIPLTPIKDYQNYLDKFETDKTEVLKALQDLSKNQDLITKSIHTNTESIITSTIEELKQKITELKTRSSEYVGKYLNEIEKSLQELNNSVKNKIDTTAKGIVGSFEETIASSVAAFEQKTGTTHNNYIEQAQDAIKTYESKIALHKEDLSNFFSNQQNIIDESLTKTKGLVSEQAERMDEKMEKISVESKQLLKENVEISSETIAQAIKNAEDVSKNTLEGVIKNSSTMLLNSGNEIKKIFDNTYEEVQNKQDQLINALGAQQNDLKEKIRSQITDLMGKSSNQFSKTESDLLVMSDKLAKESISEFQSSHMGWENSFTGVLTSILNTVNEGSTELKTVIGKSINDEITKFKGEVAVELAKIQAEYLKRLEATGKSYESTFKNSINDKLVNFQDNLKKQVDLLKQKNSELTQKQTTMYESFNNSIKTSISNTGDKINTNFRSIMQTSYENALKSISNIYTENSGQAESSINSTLDILKQNSKLLLLDIDEVGKVVGEGLKTESSKLLTTVDERINKIKELAQETIENQERIINENMKKNKQILEILAQNANFSLDKASEAMKETISQFELGLNPNITKILDESKSVINATKQQVLSSIEEIKKNYRQNTHSIKETFTNTIQNSTIDIQDRILTHREQTTQLINEVNTKIDSAFQSISKTSDHMSEEIEISIKNTGKRIQQEIFSKIQQISTEMQTKLNTAVAILDLPTQMIKDIWKTFIDSKLFDSEKTWIISGQEVIIKYLEEMIQRAKASVFLLVPKFDDLNWKLIMDAHKKGRKFIVCSNLETVRDVNTLTLAFESGIELYSYPEKDFIAAFHDSEEILIAPISPKEDETVAIVSEISPMVIHISSMFADYWRKSAKKYQPK